MGQENAQRRRGQEQRTGAAVNQGTHSSGRVTGAVSVRGSRAGGRAGEILTDLTGGRHFQTLLVSPDPAPGAQVALVKGAPMGSWVGGQEHDSEPRAWPRDHQAHLTVCPTDRPTLKALVPRPSPSWGPGTGSPPGPLLALPGCCAQQDGVTAGTAPPFPAGSKTPKGPDGRTPKGPSPAPLGPAQGWPGGRRGRARGTRGRHSTRLPEGGQVGAGPEGRLT